QSAGAGSSALVTTGSMIAKGTGADFRVLLTALGSGGDITVGGPIISGAGTGANSAVAYAKVLSNKGDIDINGSVTLNPVSNAGTANVQGSGSVLITTQGGAAANITLAQGISVDAKSDSIQILAGNNVTMGASGDISVTQAGSVGKGDVDVTITAGTSATGNGRILMADGAVVDAGSGVITLESIGDIELSQIITTKAGGVAVDIDVTNGGLYDIWLDANDEDIIANSAGAIVQIDTTDSQGTSFDAIETKVTILDSYLGSNGNITIAETDGLTLRNVENAGAGFGNIKITSAAGDILVDFVKSTIGDITLTASAGNILEAGAGDGSVDIVTASGTATLEARNNIGNAVQAIETQVATLYASSTTAGDIYLDEYDGITYANVDTVSGRIVLTYGNTVAGPATATAVDAVGGFVGIIGHGSLDATHVYANSNGEGVTLQATTGNITATDVSALGTGTSDISITTLKAGNITLYDVTAGRDVTITSVNNVLDDDDMGTTQVTAGANAADAGDLVIIAGAGTGYGYIGTNAFIYPTNAAQVATAVDINPSTNGSLTLAADEGNIQVYQQGPLTLSNINSITLTDNLPLAVPGYQIFIGAGDALTVNDTFGATGNTSLTLAALSGDLTVNALKAASAQSGSIYLYSSDSVQLSGQISTLENAKVWAGVQIVDGGSDTTVDIIAGTAVELTAANGIGLVANVNDAIDIIAPVVDATNTTITGINLNMLGGNGLGAGAVNIHTAHAQGSGSIWINSNAPLGLTLTDVDTDKGYITVIEAAGEITVVSVESDTGNASTSDVNITAKAKNIEFAYTGSNTGIVTPGIAYLTAGTAGAAGSIISRAGTGSGYDINAAALVMTARQNVGAGTASGALETQVSNLEAVFNAANTGDAGFWLDNTGKDLTIGVTPAGGYNGVTNNGTGAGSLTIDITADAINVNESVEAQTNGVNKTATINLTAVGAGAAGDINYTLATSSIHARTFGAQGKAFITLKASDDITITDLSSTLQTDGGLSGSSIIVLDAQGATGDVTITGNSAVEAHIGMIPGIARVDIDAGRNVVIAGNVAVSASGNTSADVSIKAAGGYIDITGGGWGGPIEAAVSAFGGAATSVALEAKTDITINANTGGGSYGVYAKAASGDAVINISAGAGANSSGAVTVSSKVVAEATGDATINIGAAGDTAAMGAKTGANVLINAGGSILASAGVTGSDTAEVNVDAEGSLTVNGGKVQATVVAGSGHAQVNLGGTGVNKIGGDITILGGGIVSATGGVGASDYVKAYADGAIIVGVNGAGSGKINVASATGTATLSGSSVVIGSGVAGSVKASGSVKAEVTITSTGADITIGQGAGGVGTVKANSAGAIGNVTLTSARNVEIGGSNGSGKVYGTAAGTATIDVNAANNVEIGANTGVALVQSTANKAVITLDAASGVINVAVDGSGTAIADVKAVGTATGSIIANANTNISVGVFADGLIQAGGAKALVTLNATTGDVGISSNTGFGSVLALATGNTGTVTITAGTDIKIGQNANADGSVKATASTGAGVATVNLTGKDITVGGTAQADVKAIGDKAQVNITSTGATGIFVGAGDTVLGSAKAGSATVTLAASADVEINGTVQAISTGNKAILNIGTTGTAIAGGIAINAGATVSASGAAATGTKVVLSAGGDISIDAPVSVADSVGTVNMSVRTINGDITTTNPGTLTATGANHAIITVNGGGATKSVNLGGNVTAIANGLSGVADLTVQSAGTGSASTALVTSGSMIAKGTGVDFRVQLTDSGAGGDITVSGPIVSGA
ncbi:MAG: hypothetical protein JEZ11_28120, partial [Desulfobacterales bacterium]|nr:hypothetical protein [Desulfobacterales bacterium]